jgi:uncharacterized protein YukE
MREDEVGAARAAADASPSQALDAADRLRAFVDRSETVFLDAGERLAHLEKQALALVQVSAGAASLAGAGEGDPSERLTAELARLDGHLHGARDASAAGAEGLTRMRDRAEEIVLAQDDFESTVRMLRMVGMNTRIETARAWVDAAGMETVAADVRRLVDVVESKYGAVVQEARGLRDVVADAQAAADAFLRREGGAASEILRDAQEALASLRALAAAGAKVAAEAAPHAKEVTRSVGEILVSLQAHDASRQIIEHVIEDLRAAGNARAAAGAGLDAAMGSACRLSAAQLQGARERLRDALGTIGKNLRAIAGRVGDVARDAGGIAGDAAGAGSQAERVERAVGDAARALREYLARERDAGAAMSGAAARAGDMAAHVREIEKIGTAVRIIALNARVETERIGESGRALAVTAEWMQTCAGDVVRCTSVVTRALQEIGAVSGRLGGGDDERRRGAEGEAIAAALQQLAARVTRYHEDLRAGVAALHQGSRALRAEVDEVARRLADQLAQLGVVHRVELDLGALASAAPAPSDAAAAPDAGAARAEAEARYTMQAEREVHERVMGSGEGDAGAAPEAPKPGGDLGANVELF